MAAASAKAAKAGKRDVIEVTLDDGRSPVFPAHCPCCLDKPHPGVFLRVERKEGKRPVLFPACRECVRHVGFFDRLTSVMAYLLLALVVTTVGAILYARMGWQGLLWPIRGPINGASTALGAMALFIVYALAMKPLVWPLELLLEKKTCDWFEQPVRIGNSAAAIFVFENTAYGRKFAAANGAALPG